MVALKLQLVEFALGVVHRDDAHGELAGVQLLLFDAVVVLELAAEQHEQSLIELLENILDFEFELPKLCL